MSRDDTQKLESQLFGDVEGMLKEHFQNNIHDQEANQAFLTASLKFLYRKLEKRLENVGSSISCKKSSSRTENNVFSFRKQEDPSECLPSLGYQEKVRHWASKYLHAGRTNISRSSFSAAASRENFHPKKQNTFHTNLRIQSNPVIHSGQKSDESGTSITSTSQTSSDDRMLIIVSSEISERRHDCENCVSLNSPDTSTSSVNDYQRKLLKNEYKDLISDAIINSNAWKGQNITKNEENGVPDKCFSVTQSLEVTTQESITLDVNGMSKDEIFKSDASTESGSESVTMSKDPSSSEMGYPDGIKDEGVFPRASLSNPVTSRNIATARSEVEIRSNASSPVEVKKSKTRPSRVHAAIFNLFGAKNIERKSGSKSGPKSSKSCPCKNDDMLKSMKRTLSNKLSMHSTGMTVTSDQQTVKQNSRVYHRSAFSGKSSEVGRLVKSHTASCSSQKSKLEKLKKLKVCQIPFVPVCKSCDQIYTYSFSGRTTRDVATCTEELITGYSEYKRCLSAIHNLDLYRSKNKFRKMPDKLHHHDEIEELSAFVLCTLLNDLRKFNRNGSSKVNSKSKRRSLRLTDVRNYGATPWPRNIRHHREHRTKTQQIYEKCVLNSRHKQKPDVLRQPSKFSAWNGDEKSSDSDDEEYRLKRHQLLPEHVVELEKLKPGKKLRTSVESSLVVKSSQASEHIPISKAPEVV